MKKILIALIAFYPGFGYAQVYKCTDGSGNTSYQSGPCDAEKKAFTIDIKTGSKVDLSEKPNLLQQQQLKEQQQALEKQKQLQQEQQRRQAVSAEQAITLALIQNNPGQFSIYSIPPYQIDKLPALVEQFKNRLPDIEKFRRLAAQKALATGQCGRVESDELNIRSKKTQLVFLVDCSSGQSFYFNETELSAQ